MKLIGEDGVLEIEAAQWSAPPIPGADHDLLLIVHVEAHGFAGTTDVWIDRQAWHDFLRALSDLDRARRGSATLESPGELELTFESTDRAGHMAVRGLVGVRSGHHSVALTFSRIRFDPTFLPSVLAQLRKLAHAVADPR